MFLPLPTFVGFVGAQIVQVMRTQNPYVIHLHVYFDSLPAFPWKKKPIFPLSLIAPKVCFLVLFPWKVEKLV